jgi:hypothetical protein
MLNVVMLSVVVPGDSLGYLLYIRAQWYKTIYIGNLLLLIISWSVCHLLQTKPNVLG